MASPATAASTASTPDPALGRRLANLRDVAGLPTADGRRTAPGVLLRSDAPLVGDEPPALAWPPRAVVDLRSAEESSGPHPLADVAAIHRVPLTDALSPDAQARAGAGDLPMGEMYRLLVETGTSWLTTVLEVAADGPGPALLHCAAGKDRTGVAVAVLLRLAGVTRAAVEADFVRTNAHRVALWNRLRAQDALADDVRPENVGVRLYNLTPMLDRLDRDGAERVVTDAGVPAELVERWRRRILLP